MISALPLRGGGGVEEDSHIKRTGCWSDGGASHQRLHVDMMFKTFHGSTPEYLQSRFVSRNDIAGFRMTSLKFELRNY